MKVLKVFIIVTPYYFLKIPRSETIPISNSSSLFSFSNMKFCEICKNITKIGLLHMSSITTHTSFVPDKFVTNHRIFQKNISTISWTWFQNWYHDIAIKTYELNLMTYLDIRFSWYQLRHYNENQPPEPHNPPDEICWNWGRENQYFLEMVFLFLCGLVLCLYKVFPVCNSASSAAANDRSEKIHVYMIYLTNVKLNPIIIIMVYTYQKIVLKDKSLPLFLCYHHTGYSWKFR